MVERPTIGDVVGCAAVGAMAGGAMLGLVLTVGNVFSTGRIDNIVLMIGLVPLSALIAFFAAWPIGSMIGGVTFRFLGGGYWQAGVGGFFTGMPMAWLFEDIAYSTEGYSWYLAIGLLGVLSGVIGWRMQSHAAVFRAE